MISFVIVYLLSWISNRESAFVQLKRLKERHTVVKNLVVSLDEEIQKTSFQTVLTKYHKWTLLLKDQRSGIYELSAFNGPAIREIYFRLKKASQSSSSLIQQIKNSPNIMYLELQVSDDGGQTVDSWFFLSSL